MVWRGSIVMVGLLVGCGGGGGDGDASESGQDGSGSSQASTGASDALPPDTTGEPAVTTGAPQDSSSSGGETTSTPEPTGSSSGDETGPPPVEDVPVFLAQGHYGRTTISCDDGRTWVQDKSADDAVRCFEDDLDCDHNEFAGRGVAFGDGQFVLTWGWGAPGSVVRSEDAALFTTVLTETPTFADIAFGNGRFVANNSTTRISDDGGLTWVDGGPLDINMNTRAIEFVPHDGGVFIVAGESGENRAIVRSVDGVTWTPASQKPAECASYTRGVAYGGGVIVMAGGNGSVCSSGDGGDTWIYTQVSEGLSSPPVWTGGEFYVYQGSTLHRSADGVTWANEAITPADASIGPLARSPEGTYVAANDGWMVWYEEQRFFRSEDGKAWEALPQGDFVGSHPINFIEYGRVAPGAGCSR